MPKVGDAEGGTVEAYEEEREEGHSPNARKGKDYSDTKEEDTEKESRATHHHGGLFSFVFIFYILEDVVL